MKVILTRLTWGPKGVSGYNANGFQFRLEQPWMIELMNRAIYEGLVAIDREKKRLETYASRVGEDVSVPSGDAAVHPVQPDNVGG